jgi:aspartate kinase
MMARPVLATRRALVVQKYGGTSLGSPDLIARAARRVLAARSMGKDVIVVVSAMAGETDRLLTLARGMSPGAPARELDVVASAGEQVSAGLMAIALRAAGAGARSWLGHQLPILTDSTFGSAQINSIDPTRLTATLDAGEIPVVAGFQGVDPVGNVTTIGRGGSDTTAVAVAAAVRACCEIYTDVDGVYTIDPRVSEEAQRLPAIGYGTMHAFAASGAKVLETRSVKLAMRHRVPVHVRSSMSPAEGTWVVEDDDERVTSVAGIAIARTSMGGEPCAEVSIIGPRITLDVARVEREFAAQGLRVLASRRVHLGMVYAVPAKDAASAACLLHTMYGLADEPRAPRRSPLRSRVRGVPYLVTRTEEMERS